MASGALFGFIITILIYLLFYWIPPSVKSMILLLLVLIYLIRELGILSIGVPQNHWQIPTYWVNRSPLKNMIIWGTVLGAGIFTYNPYFTFYFMYLYIGFLLSPPMGLLGGAIYGLSRCIPSLIIAARRQRRSDLSIKNNSKTSRYLIVIHIFVLPLVVMNLIYIILV